MEAVGHDDQFGEREGKPITTKRVARDEDRQTVALMLPEARVVEQSLSWPQSYLHISAAQSLLLKSLLGLSQQVLEPYRVLLCLGARPMGGHVQRHAATSALVDQRAELLPVQQVHQLPSIGSISRTVDGCRRAGSPLLRTRGTLTTGIAPSRMRARWSGIEVATPCTISGDVGVSATL